RSNAVKRPSSYLPAPACASAKKWGRSSRSTQWFFLIVEITSSISLHRNISDKGRTDMGTTIDNVISNISIEPVTGYTGAEIKNVDLSADLDDAVYEDIRNALYRYGVIFFRDQHLTPEQYVAFGTQFGEVSVSKSMPTHPEHPLINQLIGQPDQARVIGEVWHHDQA